MSGRGSQSANSSSYSEVGGVVGYNAGTIRNCINDGGTVTSHETYSCRAGGVAGGNNGLIEDSSSAGANVTARSYYDTNGRTAYAGGIVGRNYANGTVNRCASGGNILAETRYIGHSLLAYAGGAAGDNAGSIRNYRNVGVIKADSSGGQDRTDYRRASSGGITGYNTGTGATIRNCVNHGTITAHAGGWNSPWSFAGGLVGDMFGTVENSFNTGMTSATRTQHYSQPLWNKYYGSQGLNWAGGLLGNHNSYSGTITYCYWDRDKNGWWRGNNDDNGSSLNLRTFTSAPGKLNSNVTIPGYSATDDLKTALNNRANGNSTYSNWELNSAVYDNYPFLKNSHFTIFEGNNGTPAVQIWIHTAMTPYGDLPNSYWTDWPFYRKNYGFVGWFDTSLVSGGNEITNNSTVSSTNPRTVYARWKGNPVHVYFTDNYGFWDYIEQTFNDYYKLPSPTPTRTGYTHAGWWTLNGTNTGNWGT